jgi:hypothetical protein
MENAGGNALEVPVSSKHRLLEAPFGGGICAAGVEAP